MKKKNKDKPVALTKLLELKDAFVEKQSEIVDDVMAAIKEGKKNRKLKKLTKKFDKLKNKLGLLAEEIQEAIDVDFSDNDTQKKKKADKKKVSAKKNAVKKKKKKKKELKLLPKQAKSLKAKDNSEKGSKDAVSKTKSAVKRNGSSVNTNSPKSRKPVSRKPSEKKTAAQASRRNSAPVKVGTTDGPGLRKVPVRSMDLNAKKAVRGMQDVNSLDELDKYLTGETRSTVLKRANSRRNALTE